MPEASKKSNVIDSPLKRGGEDSLGVDSHVKSLVEFIGNAQMPTTLAIQGEWGSGKTSLMNQLSHNLCEMSDGIHKDEKVDNKPFYGIWLNTWQYSLMKSPEETLLSIIKKITDEVVAIIEKRHPNKNSTEKVQRFAKALFKMSLKAAVTRVVGDATIVEELSNNENSSEISPLVFRDALAEAIKECLVKDGENKAGFLFFIDDLDRLDPPVAVQILEILKNLFEVDNCIFILAIDYDVVVKGLEPKFGKLTEKNEREFRSFFDKIIQIPFNMPVASYKIGKYLADPLANIGFFTKEEMSHEIIVTKDEGTKQATQENIKLSDVLEEMIKLSTGFNPRSIKRLINTLSLILIMNKNKATNDTTSDLEVTEGEKTFDLHDKILTFGLVCVQISYPFIYNFLELEPNIRGWDKKTGSVHSLPELEPDTVAKLNELEEFNDPWEQILYRKCLGDSYLEARAPSVSKLLSKIWDTIIGDEQTKIDAITKILGVASVTTVNTADVNNAKNNDQKKLVRFDTLEEFLENYPSHSGGGELPQNIRKIASKIYTDLVEEYDDTIRVNFFKNYINFCVKTNKRIFVTIRPHYEEGEGWYINWSTDTRYEFINTLNPSKENALTDTFFRVVKRSFNSKK